MSCDLLENLSIEFPIEEDEDEIPEDCQDIIRQFLCHNPMNRLGSSSREGVTEVKNHEFFAEVDWDDLLRMKAEFIPQLQGDEDTSYFDSKNRYTCI